MRKLLIALALIVSFSVQAHEQTFDTTGMSPEEVVALECAQISHAAASMLGQKNAGWDWERTAVDFARFLSDNKYWDEVMIKTALALMETIYSVDTDGKTEEDVFLLNMMACARIHGSMWVPFEEPDGGGAPTNDIDEWYVPVTPYHEYDI